MRFLRRPRTSFCVDDRAENWKSLVGFRELILVKLSPGPTWISLAEIDRVLDRYDDSLSAVRFNKLCHIVLHL